MLQNIYTFEQGSLWSKVRLLTPQDVVPQIPRITNREQIWLINDRKKKTWVISSAVL